MITRVTPAARRVRWLHRRPPVPGTGQAGPWAGHDAGPRARRDRRLGEQMTATGLEQAAPTRGRWAVRAGWAAFGWGLIFGAISIYWGCGGTLGLNTIGGSIERLAREHNTGIFVAVWVTGLAKLVGATLALALVRPWGDRLPRRPVVILSWVATVVITLYGAITVAGDALGVAHVIHPKHPVARTPLLWHLWVWDMSFLVWGLLFGCAAWYFTRVAATRRPAPR